MATHVQILDLIDDPVLIAEYEAHHRRVWPEVLEGLQALGIRSMRIWRHGTRLVMVMETGPEFDPARYQAYASTPQAREWDELMRRFQRPVPGAAADAWWTPMGQVFDLQEALRAGAHPDPPDAARRPPLDAQATPP